MAPRNSCRNRKGCNEGGAWKPPTATPKKPTCYVLDFWAGGSKLTWFFVLEYVYLHCVWVVDIDFVFCVRAENYSALSWGWKLTWFLLGWPKLTWFSCADRRWLCFCALDRSGLVFVRMVKLTWFLCSAENDMVLGRGSIHLIFV